MRSLVVLRGINPQAAGFGIDLLPEISNCWVRRNPARRRRRVRGQ